MSDKDIYDNSDEIIENTKNNDFESEALNYDKNNFDSEESKQDSREGTSNKEKANESEGCANASEKEDTSLQEGADVREGEAVKENSERSCAEELNSAEYVWNASSESADGSYHFSGDKLREHVGAASEGYTVYNSTHNKEQPKKKKKRKGLAVTLTVVACLLAFCLAGGAFLWAAPKVISFFATSYENNRNITLVKNDKPIKVETQIKEDGSVAMSKADVVEKVADSVVEIATDLSSGSGVIIAQSNNYAYIITNEHVISGASAIKIKLTDASEYMATYLDGDAFMDIAMLRISKNKTLTVAELGSSSSLRIGDEVLAIGNAFGILGGSVTSGIISGIDRETTINTLKLLQTDAAVNPGNSGGGLFNMAGELVGVVNAKTATSDSDNTGYAIPIDSIENYIVEIIEDGYIHGRPTIGIEAEYIDDSIDAIRKYSTSTTGVFVTASSNSGIKKGDYIESINGIEVKDAITYTTAVMSLKVGDVVEVVLYRNGGGQYWDKHTVSVNVVEYVPSGIFG